MHYEVMVNGHFVDPMRVKLARTREFDGKMLASAGKEGMVKVWNPVTAQLVKNLPDFPDQLQAVAFSHDSRVMATANWIMTHRWGCF